MKKSILIIGFALAACSSSPTSTTQSLATACQSFGAAYTTAAVYVKEGKLSAAEISTLQSLEPAALAACNPATAPSDPTAALAQVQSWLQQWALMQAQVK